MKALSLRLVVMILGAVLIFTGSCAGTRPSKFYTLNALTAPVDENRFEAAEKNVAVGIGPVRFPDYLKRPQIVTRNSVNALEFSEFHRWGGGLENDFIAVLAENISILLATDRVSLFPWKSATPIDYRITADVIQFEGRVGDGVVLKARWTIFDGTGKKVITMKKSDFSAPVDGNTYEALVSAQSQILASLSREIAAEINVIVEGRLD